MNVNFLQGNSIKDMILLKDTFENGTFLWNNETERLYIKMKDKIIGITPGDRVIKEIKCKECNAPIKIDPHNRSSIVKCEFCGNYYDIDCYNNDISNKNVEKNE